MTYSMAVGGRDATRQALMDRFYNASSRAFCESAGIAEGDTVAELGCGHGSMTRWLAERVGSNGVVYAVVPGYLEHTRADPADIERHRAFLGRVIPDPDVTVELFPTTQYVARPTSTKRYD
jgi:cyclopropane fatty-acyl-phospholipid synthase-like methyltransferase